MSHDTESLAGIKNAGVNTEEAPEYVIQKDGHGVEHKIVNLNHPKYKRKGIVELKPTRSSTRHATSVRFTKWQDPMTQIIYGVFTGVDSKTKELRFQSILLYNDVTFDLSNPVDAKKWAVLQYAPFIVGSPNFKAGQKTQYKVYDKEQEANQFLATRAIKRKAVDIAEGLVGDSLVDMARDLGMDPKHYSTPTLHAEVIKVAEENHKRFLDVWDNPNRSFFTIMKRAIAVGVITQDPMYGFMFGAHQLGLTEGSVVDYLRNNERLAVAMDEQARNKEAASVKAMMATKAEAPKTGRDAELERALKEIEDLKEMNKNLSKKALEKELDETGTVAVDDELNELRKKGKLLGIKNPAIYGKDKLKAKIEELEKQNA